jgi:leucyl/phenylalanyl-tRNA--protein transferase
MSLTLLDTDLPVFPNPDQAATDPDGLLAVGGNLQPETLLTAYNQGIFPWYNQNDPIMWWSPSERCVIQPQRLHISRSLKKYMARGKFAISRNSAFVEVIKACANRENGDETWITSDMIEAYTKLHQLGHAHSLEVWDGDSLIGGIYGLEIGRIFCGESMFSRAKNGSKIALVYLCQHMINRGFKLLDCQLVNPHLMSMGAESIPRNTFLSMLYNYRDQKKSWC